MYIHTFKPFSKQFFFKKIYEVICIINFKKTLFKGFIRGGLGALSREAKFKTGRKNIK
jgi:hypothetical protein